MVFKDKGTSLSVFIGIYVLTSQRFTLDNDPPLENVSFSDVDQFYFL